jgi:hypothetical protein
MAFGDAELGALLDMNSDHPLAEATGNPLWELDAIHANAGRQRPATFGRRINRQLMEKEGLEALARLGGQTQVPYWEDRHGQRAVG